MNKNIIIVIGELNLNENLMNPSDQEDNFYLHTIR